MKQKLNLVLVLVVSALISACGEKSLNDQMGSQTGSSTANPNPNLTVIPAELLSNNGNGTGVPTGTGALPNNPQLPSNDKITALILDMHREVFKGTQYDHSSFNPAAVVKHYRDAYNPANGNGCKRVAYVFLANHPAREQVLKGSDAALREFIVAHYRGLVPKHYAASTYATNSQNVYNWYVQGYLTLDQMAAIFLDDAEFIARCQAAGMGL